jgi:hypothetical protein
MNNQKYVREKLQSQGWLDTQVSQVIDNLSEYDIIQIRNSIAHNLPPNIKTKGSKSIKELEAELFKGWELKKDADAKAATELIELPISICIPLSRFPLSSSLNQKGSMNFMSGFLKLIQNVAIAIFMSFGKYTMLILSVLLVKNLMQSTLTWNFRNI